MPEPTQPIHGRGASSNPKNRFETIHYEPDPDADLGDDDETPAPKTIFLRDSTRSIIATNDSPDVGFDASINPYRGCEHGCIYCYARPTHEYLGFSAGLDFETRIMVKEDAPALLREALAAPKWRPQTLAISGVTDAYQPIERKLRLTRGCLEVLAEFRNPVAIVTKNKLVTRDSDLLGSLAKHNAAAVYVSVTSLNPELARQLEPRASTPFARLAAIGALASVGIPVGVMVAPVIPGLTDHELPAILAACAKQGAQFAGYQILRLPFAVADLFERWLDEHAPDRKEKVLSRIRALRSGKRNDPRFGTRMRGEGPWATAINRLFHAGCQRAGIARGGPALSPAAFRRPGEHQERLFE